MHALCAAVHGHTSNRAAEDAARQALSGMEQALERIARALGLPPLSERATQAARTATGQGGGQDEPDEEV